MLLLDNVPLSEISEDVPGFCPVHPPKIRAVLSKIAVAVMCNFFNKSSSKFILCKAISKPHIFSNSPPSERYTSKKFGNDFLTHSAPRIISGCSHIVAAIAIDIGIL